jgi:hypothetical protein
MGKLRMIAALTALGLAACGEKPAPVEEVAASLRGGLYELNAEVTELAAADKGTPATKLKLGEKQLIKACVTADGKLSPELLAEDGDTCKFQDNYVRNGRINAQLNCTREGQAGTVMPAIAGTFKADSFEGEVATTTYFAEDGDYRLTRKVSARRVGECPPEPPGKAAV